MFVSGFAAHLAIGGASSRDLRVTQHFLRVSFSVVCFPIVAVVIVGGPRLALLFACGMQGVLLPQAADDVSRLCQECWHVLCSILCLASFILPLVV